VNNTYFILSRQIFESAIWRDNPHILKLFIYLIGNARHSKEPKKYPNVIINRGELVKSLSQISEENEYVSSGTIKNWSRQKVSRMLSVLEKQAYINKISDTYGTHIKVCNYDLYQSPDTYKSDTCGTLADSDGTPVEHLRTEVAINNNDKNGNNDNNDKEEKIKLHSFGNRRSLVLSNPDLDICKHFLDYIKVNHPNKVNSIVGLKKPKEDWQVYEVWLNDMRLLNNRGYDRDKILKAMENAINDDFWRDNFYSISKLNRKNKYDIYFIDVFLDIKIKQTKVQKSKNALKEWFDEQEEV